MIKLEQYKSGVTIKANDNNKWYAIQSWHKVYK